MQSSKCYRNIPFTFSRIKLYAPTTVNDYCTCISVCYKPTLLNGTLSPGGNATVGNTTTATCADGYRIAGAFDNDIVTAVLTCGVNGTWNRTVYCEPKGAC